MATLDGSGRQVGLGLGITVRAPGLRGRAEAHNIAVGSATRAPDVDGSGPALERALAEQGFLRLRVIELEVAAVPVPAGTGQVRAPDSDLAGMEVSVPDLGPDVAQVLLAVDENGITTWNFPVDATDALAPATRGAGDSVRFIVPAFASVPAPAPAPGEEGDTTRGLLGMLGKKVLELIALPLGELIAPPLAGAAARLWESNSRRARARTFTPLNYRDGNAPDLTEADWQRLAVGRSLWFVHGTFVTAHTSFQAFPPAILASLSNAYGGRVAALDHHTLGVSPLENVEALAASMPDGLELEVDLVCHSRGGLVGRALARPGSPFKVRRIIHVATPNHGTALASPNNLVPFIDRITTMVNLIPDGGLALVETTLTAVLTVVKVIAKYGVSGIPGLAAMDTDGDFLAAFNAAPVSAEQYAISADYSPSGALLALTLKSAENLLVDKVFGDAANDLVVPTAGVYEGSGAVDIPEERRLVLTKLRAIYHGTFFGEQDVAEKISGWLTG
ncbi:MAG: hypothetical protein IPL43_15120 [Micropruina sp.]|nr:hypothetical protein [Micropruina sp.]